MKKLFLSVYILSMLITIAGCGGTGGGGGDDSNWQKPAWAGDGVFPLIAYSADGQKLGYMVNHEVGKNNITIFNEELGITFRLGLLGPDNKGRFSFPSDKIFYRDVNCEGLYLNKGYVGQVYGFYYKVYEDDIGSYPEGIELWVVSSTQSLPYSSMGYRGSMYTFAGGYNLDFDRPECPDGCPEVYFDWLCNQSDYTDYLDLDPIGQYSKDWWASHYPNEELYKFVPLAVADLPFTYPIQLPIRISSE